MLRQKIACIFISNQNSTVASALSVEKQVIRFMPLTRENFRIHLFIVNRLIYTRMYISIIAKIQIAIVKFLWNPFRLQKLPRYVPDEAFLDSMHYDNTPPIDTDGNEVIYDNKKRDLNSVQYRQQKEKRKKNNN